MHACLSSFTTKGKYSFFYISSRHVTCVHVYVCVYMYMYIYCIFTYTRQK